MVIDEDDFYSFCIWLLLISLLIALICLAPFVCSILHLLGLCHFQCFNYEMVWVYTALSAIAGVLLLSAFVNNYTKFIFATGFVENSIKDFLKKMILYHHKLKNPNRAKELNEVEE
ncbi:hypothetical protein ACTNCL_06020 [Segatella copri]|uniref:hypothetical protein n=1 Tax=Segatella copri TaxID=165179 RepID=UPI003F8B58BA